MSNVDKINSANVFLLSQLHQHAFVVQVCMFLQQKQGNLFGLVSSHQLLLLVRKSGKVA